MKNHIKLTILKMTVNRFEDMLNPNQRQKIVFVASWGKMVRLARQTKRKQISKIASSLAYSHVDLTNIPNLQDRDIPQGSELCDINITETDVLKLLDK